MASNGLFFCAVLVQLNGGATTYAGVLASRLRSDVRPTARAAVCAKLVVTAASVWVGVQLIFVDVHVLFCRRVAR